MPSTPEHAHQTLSCSSPGALIPALLRCSEAPWRGCALPDLLTWRRLVTHTQLSDDRRPHVPHLALTAVRRCRWASASGRPHACPGSAFRTHACVRVELGASASHTSGHRPGPSRHLLTPQLSPRDGESVFHPADSSFLEYSGSGVLHSSGPRPSWHRGPGLPCDSNARCSEAEPGR